MSRICSKCKTENLDEANYCKECGTKLGKVCPRCWKKSGQENSCSDSQCGINGTLRKEKIKTAPEVPVQEQPIVVVVSIDGREICSNTIFDKLPTIKVDDLIIYGQVPVQLKTGVIKAPIPSSMYKYLGIKEKIEEICNLLENISLSEWKKLRECIDREFDSQANKTRFVKRDTFTKTLEIEFMN